MSIRQEESRSPPSRVVHFHKYPQSSSRNIPVNHLALKTHPYGNSCFHCQLNPYRILFSSKLLHDNHFLFPIPLKYLRFFDAPSLWPILLLSSAHQFSPLHFCPVLPPTPSSSSSRFTSPQRPPFFSSLQPRYDATFHPSGRFLSSTQLRPIQSFLLNIFPVLKVLIAPKLVVCFHQCPQLSRNILASTSPSRNVKPSSSSHLLSIPPGGSLSLLE